MDKPFLIGDILGKDLLICSICVEYYKDPRILPCDDTFCRKCLQGVFDSKQSRTSNKISNMPCPKCNKPTPVPTIGVSGFPLDINIRKMKEEFMNKLMDNVGSNSDGRSSPKTNSLPRTAQRLLEERQKEKEEAARPSYRREGWSSPGGFDCPESPNLDNVRKSRPTFSPGTKRNHLVDGIIRSRRERSPHVGTRTAASATPTFNPADLYGEPEVPPYRPFSGSRPSRLASSRSKLHSGARHRSDPGLNDTRMPTSPDDLSPDLTGSCSSTSPSSPETNNNIPGTYKPPDSDTTVRSPTLSGRPSRSTRRHVHFDDPHSTFSKKTENVQSDVTSSKMPIASRLKPTGNGTNDNLPEKNKTVNNSLNTGNVSINRKIDKSSPVKESSVTKPSPVTPSKKTAAPNTSASSPRTQLSKPFEQKQADMSSTKELPTPTTPTSKIPTSSIKGSSFSSSVTSRISRKPESIPVTPSVRSPPDKGAKAGIGKQVPISPTSTVKSPSGHEPTVETVEYSATTKTSPGKVRRRPSIPSTLKSDNSVSPDGRTPCVSPIRTKQSSKTSPNRTTPTSDNAKPAFTFDNNRINKEPTSPKGKISPTFVKKTRRRDNISSAKEKPNETNVINNTKNVIKTKHTCVTVDKSDKLVIDQVIDNEPPTNKLSKSDNNVNNVNVIYQTGLIDKPSIPGTSDDKYQPTLETGSTHKRDSVKNTGKYEDTKPCNDILSGPKSGVKQVSEITDFGERQKQDLTASEHNKRDLITGNRPSGNERSNHSPGGEDVPINRTPSVSVKPSIILPQPYNADVTDECAHVGHSFEVSSGVDNVNEKTLISSDIANESSRDHKPVSHQQEEIVTHITVQKLTKSNGKSSHTQEDEGRGSKCKGRDVPIVHKKSSTTSATKGGDKACPAQRSGEKSSTCNQKDSHSVNDTNITTDLEINNDAILNSSEGEEESDVFVDPAENSENNTCESPWKAIYQDIYNDISREVSQEREELRKRSSSLLDLSKDSIAEGTLEDTTDSLDNSSVKDDSTQTPGGRISCEERHLGGATHLEDPIVTEGMPEEDMTPENPMYSSMEAWNVSKHDYEMPTSLAILSNGTTVVSEFNGGHIQYYDDSGTFLHNVGGIKPFCIAINKNDQVIVADRKHKTIRGFDEYGVDVTQWEDNQFKWISGVGCLKDGNFVIYDRDNYKVGIYKKHGEKVYEFGSYGERDTQLCMADFLAVDSQDRILLCDSGNHCIKVFDVNGHFVCKFGTRGHANGQMEWPKGICCDKNDNIVVADNRNRRVSLYSPQGEFIQHLVKDIPNPYGVCVNQTSDLLGITHYALSGFSQLTMYKLTDYVMDETEEP